jgi:hypothetical protein
MKKRSQTISKLRDACPSRDESGLRDGAGSSMRETVSKNIKNSLEAYWSLA